MAELLYLNLIPVSEQAAFGNKVIDVANRLGTDANWLMQIMKAESGLRADAKNTKYPFKNGYATGLIQFTPDTAIGLGTTTTALAGMSRTDQMEYVYKYLSSYKNRLKSYFDLYLAIFFPAAIPYSNQDNYVFETSKISRSAIARSNPAIDINKDGLIKMGEFRQYLINTVQEKYRGIVFDKKKS